MLYVYRETGNGGSVLLVKAQDSKEVERILKVGDDVKFLGSFTTAEFELLNGADFVIVKS